MARLAEFNCATCGKRNVKRVMGNDSTPKYCDLECYHANPEYLFAEVRAVAAYELRQEGLTLQAIGNQLGGVTRERARQLVIKGKVVLDRGRHDTA